MAEISEDFEQLGGLDFVTGSEENALTWEQAYDLRTSIMRSIGEKSGVDYLKDEPADMAERRVNGFIEKSKTDDSVIIKDGDKPVGFVALDDSVPGFVNGRPFVCIENFIVLPEYRNGGVGRRLMEAVLEKGREKYPNGVFYLYTPNPKVKHLAKDLGMVEIPYMRMNHFLKNNARNSMFVERRFKRENSAIFVSEPALATVKIPLVQRLERRLSDEISYVCESVGARIRAIFRR